MAVSCNLTPSAKRGGLNIYTYCHNDPVNGSDPSGLANQDINGNSAPKKNYDFADPAMASLFGQQQGNNYGITSFGQQFSSGHWQDVPDTGYYSVNPGGDGTPRINIVGHDPIWVAGIRADYMSLNVGVVVNPNMHLNLQAQDRISFQNPGNFRSYYFYGRNYNGIYGRGALLPKMYARMGSMAKSFPPQLLLDLPEFYKGGLLDAQVRQNGDASPAYGNYVYGVYMENAGFSLDSTLSGANLAAPSSYANPMPFNSTFTNLPEANVNAITSGFNDASNGTLWGGND